MAEADDTLGLSVPAFALRRRSTGEQVAQALREAILAGRLKPGAHLREAPLADAFQVSRNTIRGAIQALARDGLVTHRVHRGASVTELEPEAIRDVYLTRRIIELSAIEMPPPQASLPPLEAALKALRVAIDANDDDAMVTADLQFHRALADLAESPRLSALFTDMEAETRLSTLLVGNVHPDAEGLYDQHREILESLRSGDVESARSLLQSHLGDSERLLLDALAARRAEAS
jgi:DNA-binding GntR family transcriptional regulator